MRNAIIAAGIVFLSLSGLLSCSGREQEERAPQLRPVRAVQVYSTGAARQRSFSGVARAGVEARISFKIPGNVERIFVKVGDTVDPGDPIAELDDTDNRLQVEDAEAALAQAQAKERNASTEYERVRGLYENRNASRQDLDAARTVFESAQASVQSIQKRLELARRQLGYCHLEAPVAGSIASMEVEVNENVSAGQTICLLTAGSDIEVEVAIPEVLITGVREGDAVTVEFDALPNRTFSARVTEVGVAATGVATTFPVTVRLDQADDDVLSGMAAEVTFSFGNGGGSSRIVVDSFAVSEDRLGRFVWVVSPSAEPDVGVVERRAVTIGGLVDQGIEITGGLEDGEWVVTAGVSKLSDGERVRFETGVGTGEE
jgi:RND family efflux transporter MFP subunit